MKRLLPFLILFVFFNCANYTKSKSEPFKIKGANYNYWTGGQPGVSGIKVIVRYESKVAVDFQRIFFKDKSAKVELLEKNESKYLIGHINTSKLPESVVLEDDYEEPKSVKKDPIFPFKLKDNEIAVSYLEEGELKYYLIKDAKETASENFP